MARIRTIKPSFFTSLTIAKLSVETRLTFIGLWTHVDDEGRCVYDARLIKAAVWPLDDRTAADVERDVCALIDADLVTHYVVTEDSVSQPGVLKRTPYLWVNGWGEHQRINRPTESHLPGIAAGEIQPVTCAFTPSAPLTEDSVRTHARKGREGNKDSVPTERAPQKRRGQKPPQADPAKPDPAGDVARAIYDHADGMIRFIAVREVAERALRVKDATVDSVTTAMTALYDRGRPLTFESVGQEMSGRRGSTTRQSQPADDGFWGNNPLGESA